jgi:transposase-like protein
MAGVDRNNPKRGKASESRYSLMEFMRDFPDDATCLQWLWVNRYALDGEHAYCEKCEQTRSFRRYATSQRRQSWTCVACGQHVHPTAGTIFHKSSTSLHLWFYAMYLMTATRCGISAKQLERELGVTYKTAWRMFHLIRNELMEQDDDTMSGEVEMDEMFVGGRPRQSDRARWESMPMSYHRNAASAKWAKDHKTPVFGMVQRGGKVAAYVVPNVRSATLGRVVQERVLPASIVYTDEAPQYSPIAKRQGYDHKRIHHKARVYVEGNVHTNTIEGFWSLVKRGISGTHHNVSAKHLQGYLNEYAWRYNHRDMNGPSMFRLLVGSAASPRR